MLERVAEHYSYIRSNPNEPKYRILNEAYRRGHNIGFDVLYVAKETEHNSIKNEIGNKEG